MSLLLALCLMLPVAALAETADQTNTPEVTAEVTAEHPTEAETETATEPETESEADAPAVNYFATLKLKDLYGNDFDASVFDGKPAMLNIWTDWCGYCL